MYCSTVYVFVIGLFCLHTVTAEYLNGPLSTSGDWGFWDYCHPEHFVTNFQVKVVTPLLYDDEGLSGITFGCSDQQQTNASAHKLWSYEGRHGTWQAKHYCPVGDFITGYRIRYQSPQGMFADDSATNNVQVQCSSNKLIMAEGTITGNWTNWQRCGHGYALCGLQTKVQMRYTLDQEGLVTFNTKCCQLPSAQESRTELLIDEMSITEKPVDAEPGSYTVLYIVAGTLLMIFAVLASVICILARYTSMLERAMPSIELAPPYPDGTVSTFREIIRDPKLFPLALIRNKEVNMKSWK